MLAVTYGPFPGGWPEDFAPDFTRISAAGFNSLRLYEMPPRRLLDAAGKSGLSVFAGLQWASFFDFLGSPALFSAARTTLAAALRETAAHPALAGVYVANEIPADLVRWMGPVRVRLALEDLIALGREIAPDLLFAYANFPSTEYLEPENADFTAFNVYLEGRAEFRAYLRRLHHIAGDRPLVISEFGLDSQRNGRDRQAEILAWATRDSAELETAGITVFAWSDRWSTGAEVLDWDFGLTDRAGNPKPALAALDFANPPPPTGPSVSVIVCTRNGRQRIGACLAALAHSREAHETLVVDDGSTDGTADFVAGKFPWARLLRLQPEGLSAARNAGAAAASGEILAFTDDDCEPDPEWIARLLPVFQAGTHAAAGGPNLPPAARTWEEAVVCAAPGAPSHVLLSDAEAEHLPGCNLAVTRAAFEAIGGFDQRFRTAGDDVDFCWRLRDAGFRLGFAPGAFVWHWRRPSISAFLRQQLGYGRAERLLLAKHPARFSPQGDARWQGFIYGGGPVRVMAGSVIYYGPMGAAGYQSIVNRMLPLRGLPARFDSWKSRLALAAVRHLQPRLRAWTRARKILISPPRPTPANPSPPPDETAFQAPHIERQEILAILLARGWHPAGPTAGWDLEKSGERILLAVERGSSGFRRVLLRTWGVSAGRVAGEIQREIAEE